MNTKNQTMAGSILRFVQWKHDSQDMRAGNN